ncbi:MAG TPA: glycolate oxidase subunit GlcF [Caulobacteraceae bacterium]|jgi:glycolate oxidase iron-sulfur subunit|nr:glycolate oxidase subunit GlcF [Caulobacteraceae bacterium]
MRATVIGELEGTAAGATAEKVLRACVHCGMCNATCPTYALTGDELDGPRGRIYLIKQVLEGEPADRLTQHHLDLCLSCRACETTCPSSVEYHRLFDIGSEAVARQVRRPLREQMARWGIRILFSHPRLLAPLFALARVASPVLPRSLTRQIGPGARPRSEASRPPVAGTRRMSSLPGCVQAAAAPQIDEAARRVFAHAGVALSPARGVGCCGALAFHTGAGDVARDLARRNIDVWRADLAEGAEAVVITASGCAAFVRDYRDLLADDPDYASAAAQISAAVRDPAELIADAPLTPARLPKAKRIAVHDPCTLRNGVRLDGVPAGILARVGYEPQPTGEAHMCCGSAGAYSLLHPATAGALRTRKLAALGAARVEGVCTANIGCQLHLCAGTDTPVRHWLVAVAEVL